MYIEAANLSACEAGGAIIENDSGFITSPEYPGDYPNNQFCSWTFIQPEGMVRFERSDSLISNLECSWNILFYIPWYFISIKVVSHYVTF